MDTPERFIFHVNFGDESYNECRKIISRLLSDAYCRITKGDWIGGFHFGKNNSHEGGFAFINVSTATEINFDQIDKKCFIFKVSTNEVKRSMASHVVLSFMDSAIAQIELGADRAGMTHKGATCFYIFKNMD